MLSPITYSYLPFSPNDNTDTDFAASLLTSYDSFSSLIFSSIVLISFYIIFKRFILKRERLSDARVPSITKKEYGVAFLFF